MRTNSKRRHILVDHTILRCLVEDKLPVAIIVARSCRAASVVTSVKKPIWTSNSKTNHNFYPLFRGKPKSVNRAVERLGLAVPLSPANLCLDKVFLAVEHDPAGNLIENS